MSNYERIRQWKESRPFVQRLCAAPDCGAQFETRCGGCKPACKNQCTNYCSTRCRRRHANQLKAEAAKASQAPLYCWWCSAELSDKKEKFCTRKHFWRFQWAKKAGNPVKIRVEGALVETRRYGEIDKVRAEWVKKLTTLRD